MYVAVLCCVTFIFGGDVGGDVVKAVGMEHVCGRDKPTLWETDRGVDFAATRLLVTDVRENLKQ
jgi:hypothetical protein